MNLTDLITALTTIEQRHIGYLVNVEIRDEQGVLTSDIRLMENIVFGSHGRRTVIIEVNPEANT